MAAPEKQVHKVHIGRFQSELIDELFDLNLLRDEKEIQDAETRKNRKAHLWLYNIGTMLGLCGTVYFSMGDRGSTPWGSALLVTSVLTCICSYVAGEQKKATFDNTPTDAALEAHDIDLLIYDKMARHPKYYPEGPVCKYKETPERWERRQNRISGITPS